MIRHDRPCRPALEGLESRQLLTSSSAAYWTYRTSHELNLFVGDLQRLELMSQATPAQYLALRDDARAISRAASTTTLALPEANAKALAVSLQLDRSALDGWMGDSAWDGVRSRLTANLDGLNVPPALVDQTIADMKAIATSSGVTFHDFQTFTDEFNTLRADEAYTTSGYRHFPDPGLYFTQHLRGFFRGGAVQRGRDQSKLDADLRTIGAESSDTPAEAAALASEARLLEKIGAGLPTQANEQVGQDFLATFAQGSPSPEALAQARSALVADLGAGTSGPSLSAVDHLIAGASGFFQDAGSSQANARTLVLDVRAIVADGGGSPLNPFKVEVSRSSTGASAG